VKRTWGRDRFETGADGGGAAPAPAAGAGIRINGARGAVREGAGGRGGEAGQEREFCPPWRAWLRRVGAGKRGASAEEGPHEEGAPAEEHFRVRLSPGLNPL